jgi:hypothetical protein
MKAMRAAAGLCLLAAAACSTQTSAGSPVAPTSAESQPGSTSVATTSPAPQAVSLVITAASALVSGSTTRLSATATFSNGTTKVVTSQAAWGASNTLVVVVSPLGVAIGLAAGETDVTAVYGGLAGHLHLTVGLPPTAAQPPGVDATITFNGLTSDAPLTTYSEAGYDLSASDASWVARTSYGAPKPFVQFAVAPGATTTGDVRVSGPPGFHFKSVDLYSSTTAIPYTIIGQKQSVPVFVMEDTVPHTFGTFKTVANPNAAAVIDTLVIRLTNAAAACCGNPVGLDNIVLAR